MHIFIVKEGFCRLCAGVLYRMKDRMGRQAKQGPTLWRSSRACTTLATRKREDRSSRGDRNRSSRGPAKTQLSTRATLSLSMGVANKCGTNGDGLSCLKSDLSSRTCPSRPSLCTLRLWYLFMLTTSSASINNLNLLAHLTHRASQALDSRPTKNVVDLCPH